MIFTNKYTTEALKAEISLDKEIPEATKEVENKKVVLGNDAFALCEMLEELNKRLFRLRFK